MIATTNILQSGYWFGKLDTRPLSLFRLFFACLLIKNAIYNIPLAGDFFSDFGYLPRLVLFDSLVRTSRFSIMDSISHTWMAVGFFMIWIVVALCLLLGYRTKLFSIINFVIVLSVHERNVYILNGADTVIRILSFWIMFVPLGNYYSIDALSKRFALYRKSSNIKDLRVNDKLHTTFVFPVRMIQLQISIIYLFSFFEKMKGESWKNGEALYYALQLKSLTLPTGDWVFEITPLWVMSALSYFTLAVEALFVFLVFFPIGQPFFKLVALGMGASFHISIALTMSIRDFSLVMLISYLIFCEPDWILEIDSKMRKSLQKLRLIIPSMNSPLWLLIAMTREADIIVDTNVTNHKQIDKFSAIYYQDGNRCQGLDAWVAVVSYFPMGNLLLYALRFDFFRLCIRSLFTVWVKYLVLPYPDSSSVILTNQQDLNTLSIDNFGRISRFIVLFGFMFGVVWYNLSYLVDTEDLDEVLPVNTSISDVVRIVGLWQRWQLFAPYPRTIDGWIVAPGKFEDGTTIDLRTGNSVNDEMKRWFWGPGMRWKKYEANLYRKQYKSIKFAWAAYYCRYYNVIESRSQGSRLATLELHYRFRRSHAPEEDLNEYETSVLWKHWCFSEYKY